jgi:hypothetical protein
MSAQCGPNNFTIVQQGEEPVGTDTYTQQNDQTTDHTSRSGRTTTESNQTNTVQSTRTAVVWRVHYQCNGAMPAAAPMGPPPGGQPPAGPAPAPMGPPPGQAPGQ